MTDSDSKVIRELEKRIERNSDRIEDLMRALYGNPELGQKGFRGEVLEELAKLKEDIKSSRQLCEDLRQERRDELSERRGIKRVIGYTGVTSLLTLVTMLGLLVAIWQGAFGA